MLPLPMLAFMFEGTDGDMLSLTIDEVFGYPHETCYAGGYGARGRLSIKADQFILEEAAHYFGTGELYAFMKELEVCNADVKGTAILTNTEHELTLECQFDKHGHVHITGDFQKNTEKRNCLQFDILSDQTQIAAVLGTLKQVSNLFGDKQGIKT